MANYYLNEAESGTSLPAYPPQQHTSYEPDYRTSYDDFDYDDTSQQKHLPQSPVETQAPYNNFQITAQKYGNTDGDIDFEGGYTNQEQPPAAKYEAKTSLWSRIWPHSLACRLFVLTVLLQTILDLAIEGNMIIRFADIDSTGEAIERMRVYLAIFALAHVFQFILAIDAVYNRNTLQFFFLCVFNALFLIYSGVQIGEVKAALQSVSTSNADTASSIPINLLTSSIPVVIAVCEVAYLALAYRIYAEFGWQVYKFLGADRRIKKMYGTLQVYNCIIKFDLFFWIGFSVQFIWLVLQSEKDAEYYITYAVFPLSVLLLLEGHLAARHESRWMMYFFMSGCVCALVYFVYKLYKTLLTRNTTPNQTIWESLTIFAVIAILLLFSTFFYATLILRNFGRGLKTQLDKSQSEQAQQPAFGFRGSKMFAGYGGNTTSGVAEAKRKQSIGGQQFPMSSNPYRMSIE